MYRQVLIQATLKIRKTGKNRDDGEKSIKNVKVLIGL